MKRLALTLGLIGAMILPAGCAQIPSRPQGDSLSTPTFEISQRGRFGRIGFRGREGRGRFERRERFEGRFGRIGFRGRERFEGRGRFFRPSWWGRSHWWWRGVRPWWWGNWFPNAYILIGSYYYPYTINEGYYYPDYSSPYIYSQGQYMPYTESQPEVEENPIPANLAQTVNVNPQEEGQEGQEGQEGP